jgi:D-sedoheptulose 7-phosphate isomerase
MMKSMINHEFNEHLKTSKNTMESASNSIEIAAELCISCLKKGNKILLFGNGGSAADSQHIAAEIVGRYKTERRGLPAIALTTDTSALTAIANDYGYLNIFSRQAEALANKGDVFIGISTGGSSTNVVNGLKIAHDLGCKAIGFSGKDGGDFNQVCDVNIVVPASDTPRIQEMHIVIGHTICHLIDHAFSKN